jgi:hypothetical protein
VARLKMCGAVPPLPNTPLCGAKLKHRDFTFTFAFIFGVAVSYRLDKFFEVTSVNIFWKKVKIAPTLCNGFRIYTQQLHLKIVEENCKF